MKKALFILLFIVLSNAIVYSQSVSPGTPFSGGIYMTYEDYLEGKIQKKGNLTNILALGKAIASYKNEEDVIVKVDVSSVFGFTDQFGVLWKAIPKKSLVLRTLINGDICFYLDVIEGNGFKEVRCNEKKGKPIINFAACWISKGINGELKRNPKGIKELVADSPEATEVVSKFNTYAVYDAIIIYNKAHPTKNDFIFPDCSEAVK